MDFLLIAIGSHGDVHPFVGIGRALLARGHRVRLATNEYFQPMIEQAGLTFVPLGRREVYEQMMLNPDLWHATRGPKAVWQFIGETFRLVYDTVIQHAARDTFLVGSSLAMGARIAGEKHGYRLATVHLSPICIRSHQIMPVLPGGFDPNIFPHWLRRWFWRVVDRRVVDPIIGPALNNFRAELGLPAVSSVQGQWWHSPLLTIGLWPEWFMPRQPDYPKQVRLAGFVQYDQSDHLELDADLETWLRAGDAPIAFTPGSAMRFGSRFFQAAVEACGRLGRRGLLLTQHPEQIPDRLPPNVRHISFAPFGKLLPHCRALVHHGGIGTLAQGLRAGIPQLLMPMSHDQFDNAAIARRLGVADWLGARRFTGRRVANKLQNILTTAQASCAAVAEKARGDRSIELICGMLESHGQS